MLKKPSYVIPMLVLLTMMILLSPNIGFSQENAEQEFSEKVKIETSSRTVENVDKFPEDKTPFGLKIAYFMKTALDLFEEQREITIQVIKECRKDLENTAKNVEGVEKVYAIQAGRELRVFVAPKIVDDWGCQKMAREIAGRIEEELKYPGEIKVTVIRESRVEEYAR